MASSARHASVSAAPAPSPVRTPWPGAWGQLSAWGPSVGALLAGALLWEWAGQTLHYRFLPPLSAVAVTAVELIAGGRILGYLLASLLSLAVGYGLAILVGVSVGFLMGRYRLVEYVLDPYVGAMLVAPKIVFVPILFALFGVTRGGQVAVVFLSAVFIIIVSSMNALRTVDVRYLEMARAFGAREDQLLGKVLLPGSLPMVMAGLRLGMGRAVKGMINGEMFIAVFGLGGLLRTYGSRFDAQKVFAVLLVVVTVALGLSVLLQWLETRLNRWAEPLL